MRRERESKVSCMPSAVFAKIYPPIITCPPSSLPQIPLQTTEVVKRPKISASLACTRLHCARAAMLNSPSISELAALISTESPSLFQCQKRHKEKIKGGGKGRVKPLFTNNLNISFVSYHPPVQASMEAGPNEQIHFAFRAICQNTCFLCHTQIKKKKELDKGPNGCLLPFPNSVLTRPFQTSKTPSPILRKKGESKTIQTSKSNEHNKHT